MKDGTKNAALLRRLVEGYTTYPGAIEIKSERIGGGRGELLKLRVHREDQPKVVGGLGKQIQALRVVFQFIGARDGETLRLVLLEPAGRDGQPERAGREIDEEVRQRRLGADYSASYDPDAILELAREVMGRVLARSFDVEIYDAEEKVMLEVKADRTEMDWAKEFIEYAAPIFHAIGKRQGRDLYLEARPDVKAPDPAPAP